MRNEFYNLVQQYARPCKLELVAELDFKRRLGGYTTSGGTLKDALRQDTAIISTGSPNLEETTINDRPSQFPPFNPLLHRPTN